MSDARLVLFGEVLFDHFPDGKRVLGGAPFNVAWHLQAFGQEPLFVSRVGKDEEGQAVREAMEEWGMATDALQTDPELSTGRVQVRITDGEPSYEILHPVAFDAIADPVTMTQFPHRIRLLYHGSLALRETASLKALEQIRATRPECIFVDVNLRPPWWQRREVLSWLTQANWVKLNHHELETLSSSATDEPDQGKLFLGRHELDGLLLTRGERGATALTANAACFGVTPGQDVKLVDTVGAGDAFTAVFMLGLAGDWALDLTLSRAQTFASAVCSIRGATTRDVAFYRKFIDNWTLEK